MERPRIIQGAPKDHPTPRKEQPLGTAQVAPKTTQDAPKTHPRRTQDARGAPRNHPRSTQGSPELTHGAAKDHSGPPKGGEPPLGPMGTLAHGPLEFKPHLCGDGGRLATEVDAARIGSSRRISGPPPRAHLQRGGGTSSGAGIGYPRLGRPPPRGAGNLVWSDGLGAGLHGVATQKTAAPQKKRPWA